MSKDKTRIEVGDIVNVCFYGGDAMRGATVKYLPSAPGDCWVLIGEDGCAVHVMQYETISLIEKGTP